MLQQKRERRRERKNEQKSEPQVKSKKRCQVWQCYLAEFIGTLLLTLVATAPIVIGSHSTDITHADKVVSPGLLVMAMIYTVGDLSGAHFNPAVTLAFAVRGSFQWAKTPMYWLAQLVGATTGSAITAVLFGTEKHLGATLPEGGILAAFGTEVLLTALLVLVILGSSNQHKLVGNNAALAVGATISLCGMIASPISGASMNPARSFGPALLGGAMDSLWIYLLGPCIGAMLAAALITVMHGPPSNHEVEAAEGDEQIRAQTQRQHA